MTSYISRSCSGTRFRFLFDLLVFSNYILQAQFSLPGDGLLFLRDRGILSIINLVTNYRVSEWLGSAIGTTALPTAEDEMERFQALSLNSSDNKPVTQVECLLTIYRHFLKTHQSHEIDLNAMSSGLLAFVSVSNESSVLTDHVNVVAGCLCQAGHFVEVIYFLIVISIFQFEQQSIRLFLHLGITIGRFGWL